jgi:hypothetical protein
LESIDAICGPGTYARFIGDSTPVENDAEDLLKTFQGTQASAKMEATAELLSSCKTGSTQESLKQMRLISDRTQELLGGREEEAPKETCSLDRGRRTRSNE